MVTLHFSCIFILSPSPSKSTCSFAPINLSFPCLLPGIRSLHQERFMKVFSKENWVAQLGWPSIVNSGRRSSCIVNLFIVVGAISIGRRILQSFFNCPLFPQLKHLFFKPGRVMWNIFFTHVCPVPFLSTLNAFVCLFYCLWIHKWKVRSSWHNAVCCCSLLRFNWSIARNVTHLLLLNFLHTVLRTSIFSISSEAWAFKGVDLCQFPWRKCSCLSL